MERPGGPRRTHRSQPWQLRHGLPTPFTVLTGVFGEGEGGPEAQPRRAGVEGTMHQAASHGARRARYRGLPKTRLDHVFMATALNLLGLEAYWTGTPLDRQRTSHLARLELGLAA